MFAYAPHHQGFQNVWDEFSVIENDTLRQYIPSRRRRLSRSANLSGNFRLLRQEVLDGYVLLWGP